MLVVVSTFLPATARASVLGDFIATVTGANTVQADTTTGSSTNVQTMDLPVPATNNDPSQTPVIVAAIADDSAFVPEEGPAGTLADIQKRTQSGAISVYVVKAGDTLSGIAARYGVTEGTILGANNLNAKSTIQPGDQLVILPISGLPYTVRKDDTLASIAKRFGGDPTDIGNYNGVDDTTLVVGMQITIPDAEAGAAIASADTNCAKSAKTHKSTKTKTHVASTRVLEGTSASGDVIPMANNPAEPAHDVGPVGTPAEIAYYISPLAHYVQTQGIHGFNAVDLAAPTGTPILAAADGEVIVAREGGWNGGYGSYVVITHANGSQTLYGHMSQVSAYDGERVVQGQVIGYVGETGEATGPHVHFEIRDGIRNPF